MPTAMMFAMSRPAVPSPLSHSAQGVAPAQRMTTRQTPSFPTSRALRPFPTIAHIVQPAKRGHSSPSTIKPVKLIEPPKNFKTTFVLDLTQAEFSRQD